VSLPLTTIVTKDPEATLDYAMDWAAWLAAGDAISTADWTSYPAGLIADAPPPSLAGAVARVWLTGGTPNVLYAVTCSVTTTQGRADDRTAQVRVREQ